MPLPSIKINRKTVDPRSLQEYPSNYNKHPDKQVGELAKSLDKFGQYKEVVIWNNFVIAGWGLTLASIQAGMTEIEVNDRSDLIREQAEALLVADNVLPQGAEPDNETLAALLASFDEPTREIPGVDEEWLSGVLSSIGVNNDDPPDVDFKEYDESVEDEVEYIECPKCGHKFPK